MIYVLSNSKVAAGSGSGEGLNFKVVGGTTQPASPKENTIWVNTDTEITSWDFSVTEPLRRSGNKNLIVHPYDNSTATTNGITFTPYTGGTVGASGTATAQATYYINDKNPLTLPAGTYTFSGAIDGGSSSTWVVGLKYSYDNFKNILYSTTGTSKTITFDKSVKVIVYLQVKSGVTVSGNFKPQIEKGTVATSFIKGDATGQVWIITDTQSTTSFNALKKNGIQVYPVSSKQYVDGAWVDKAIKSNQYGEWVEATIPRTYIFKSGEGALVTTKSRSGRNSSVTLTQDSIAFYCGTGDTGTVIQTQDPISLTSFSKLKARAVCTSATSTSHPAQIGFATALAGDYTVKPDISHVVITADSVEREYSLPIPSGIESAYIGIYGMFNGNVYDLWLE